MTSVHEAAHLYIAAGLRVHPIRPGSKAPAIADWPTRSTSDPAQVDQWWGPNGTHTECGIGIRTGEGLFVIDVDDVPAWEQAAETFDATWFAVTPSGGYHVWYRVPDGCDDPTNAAAAGLPPGVDVRGEGGQVVAWPTPGYEWHVRPWSDAEHFHVPVATCPTWLWDILTTEPTSHEKPAVRAVEPGGRWDVGFGAGRPGDQFNAEADARRILADAGWTHHHDTADGSHWTRPGKARREGVSATVWADDGTTSIWSTTLGWPTTEPLRPFGLYAWANHGGDYRAAARDLRAQGYGLTEATPSEVTGAELGRAALAARDHGAVPDAEMPADEVPDPRFIHWPTMWATDTETEQWSVYPLIPAGRGVAVFAPAKAGKSTVVLAFVAAAAAGKPGPAGHTGRKVRVLYCDYEMTLADVKERLEEMGYTPDDDLSHLYYCLLPTLPPLDTQKGAEALAALAAEVQAEVVVIDTFGRAVEGDENEADTAQDYYRHTGMALKAMGVAVLRCDHAGKDVDKGQRGSSAKNDDVDVVWRLTRTDDGVKLARTHTRISWVPESIELVRREDEEQGTATLRARQTRGYLHGTGEVAAILDRLDVPVGVSVRKAAAIARSAGWAGRQAVVNDAVRYRKERSGISHIGPEVLPETGFRGGDTDGAGTTGERFTNAQVRGHEVLPVSVGNDFEDQWVSVPPPKGGNIPSPTSPKGVETVPSGIDAW